MTALNAFVGDDDIHVFTDTVIYNMARGGAVEGFGSKVIPLPHQGAVMACTGFSWVSIVIAGVIARLVAKPLTTWCSRCPTPYAML
ncbi:hypothetical protein [Rhizobium rhizogenes]|uniref:hypothetical protein n=1 Tax=Rhizobium rhizogenes TaxID=359 RepID=UPI0011593712|nr:hypothetical protein [Rhizobium rhizogenes]NTI79162.1 hypothetical protein [Rhizobium rhizogenes]NTJ21263.1 hypothetical protein [Rhizobium rhizogenes]QUE80026.1 hypothetical protein EML492_18875 [Rhizobium rhizogenes]TQO78145.1 hypothetical protein FFE80_16810 [Rhizobium rhizogenes]TRB51122.1 hypothetical protein EXN69_28860 [Rhizobium rhizogenes]